MLRFVILFLLPIIACARVEIVQLNGLNPGGNLSNNQAVFGKYNGSISSNIVNNNTYDLFWELDGVVVSTKPYLYIGSQYVGSQLRFCVRRRDQSQIENCSPSSNIINSLRLRENLNENVGQTTNYIYDKRKLRAGDSIASKANFSTQNGSKASGILIYGKDQRGDIVEARFVPVSPGISDRKVYNNVNSQTTRSGSITKYSSCSVLFFENSLPPMTQETCKGPFDVGPR